MAKYLEIKWHGRAGQGVTTAAAVTAELAAAAGMYVQAFPEFIPVKRSPSIMAFNRISDTPVKTHANVENAGLVVLMDIGLSLYADLRNCAARDAVYIINTHSEPDFVMAKLNLSDVGRIITLDAGRIVRETPGAFPNIPLAAVLFQHIQLTPMDEFREQLKTILIREFGADIASANISSVERALKEVKLHDPKKMG